MCHLRKKNEVISLSVNISIKTDNSKTSGSFFTEVNPISASDESPIKLSTAGLRYQIEDSEAERKSQPPKEREKLVLV